MPAEQCVHTCLTTVTGSRAFQVDGKARTYAQVKDFLRQRCIALGGASVIQQAQVTRLADENNPTDLKMVIAQISGLARCALGGGGLKVTCWAKGGGKYALRLIFQIFFCIFCMFNRLHSLYSQFE